jgi:hypothetical protein
MLYEKMASPPEPGTPLESLMLLVWRARQDIELAKVRVLTESILAAPLEGEALEKATKTVNKAWGEFVDELFPFRKGSRREGDTSAMKHFIREAAMGPLKVTPLVPLTRGKSQLKAKSR